VRAERRIRGALPREARRVAREGARRRACGSCVSRERAMRSAPAFSLPHVFFLEQLIGLLRRAGARMPQAPQAPFTAFRSPSAKRRQDRSSCGPYCGSVWSRCQQREGAIGRVQDGVHKNSAQKRAPRAWWCTKTVQAWGARQRNRPVQLPMQWHRRDLGFGIDTALTQRICARYERVWVRRVPARTSELGRTRCEPRSSYASCTSASSRSTHEILTRVC
jgi:hypothetical protein